MPGSDPLHISEYTRLTSRGPHTPMRLMKYSGEAPKGSDAAPYISEPERPSISMTPARPANDSETVDMR